MSTMAKFLWEILVPCQWNDGRPVRTRHHRVWDAKVRDICGGLTIMRPAVGQWVDPADGRLYHERVIPVRIMATEEEISAVVQATIQHYQQLVVMHFKVSEACVITPASPRQKEKFTR